MKRKNEESQIFGKRLQKFRIERGYSIVHMANAIGVSNSTYREWEQGRSITGLPYVQIVKTLNVSFSQLFGVEGLTNSEALKKLKIMEELIAEIKVLF